MLNSAGQLPSNEVSKNIVAPSKDGELNSVQESQETDPGKYQHTFREGTTLCQDLGESPQTINKQPELDDYGAVLDETSQNSPNSKFILQGKYTTGGADKDDTLVLSSREGSMRNLSKK